MLLGLRRVRVAFLLALSFAATQAEADSEEDGIHLFVKPSCASPSPDGSVTAPFCRITDAVVLARKLRRSTQQRIFIEVGRGEYVGDWQSVPVPGNEVLPILLNVPRLTLRGETILDRDAAGLPVGVHAGTETLVTTDDPQASCAPFWAVIIRVTETTDGSAGVDTSIEGLIVDGSSTGACGSIATVAIELDRVHGFAVRGNAVFNGLFGIDSRFSSGAVEDNLVSLNTIGLGMEAGSHNRPARLIVRGNRSSGNNAGLIATGVGAVTQVANLGANDLIPEPFPPNPGRDDLPDLLEIDSAGNVLSGNTSYGLRLCLYCGPWHYPQQTTARIRGEFRGNQISGNPSWGLMADAGWIFRAGSNYLGDPPQVFGWAIDPSFGAMGGGPYGGSIEATLEGNALSGNGAPAIIGFTTDQTLGVAGTTPPDPVALLDFAFLRNATYSFIDRDGGLSRAGFVLYNPVTDPLASADQSPLRDQLILRNDP